MGVLDRILNEPQGLRNVIFDVLFAPAEFLKESFVDPIKSTSKPYPYYHRRFHRVPTIDECETDDALCRFEAHSQFRRDKKVDNAILKILRNRVKHCMYEENQARDLLTGQCRILQEQYEEAQKNYFTKYGDVRVHDDVLAVYMKQKHRLVWERRQKQLAEKEQAEES